MFLTRSDRVMWTPTNKVNKKKIHVDILFECTRGVRLIFVQNLCGTINSAFTVVAVNVQVAYALTPVAITMVIEYECLVVVAAVVVAAVVYHDNMIHSYVHRMYNV